MHLIKKGGLAFLRWCMKKRWANPYPKQCAGLGVLINGTGEIL